MLSASPVSSWIWSKRWMFTIACIQIWGKYQSGLRNSKWLQTMPSGMKAVVLCLGAITGPWVFCRILTSQKYTLGIKVWKLSELTNGSENQLFWQRIIFDVFKEASRLFAFNNLISKVHEIVVEYQNSCYKMPTNCTTHHWIAAKRLT